MSSGVGHGRPVQVTETRTIQPIPAGQRHGRPRDLFTPWFGSNLMILTTVTGALCTTVFRLSFIMAVVAIIVGNPLGGVFMALHAAQGRGSASCRWSKPAGSPADAAGSR